ncbi:MAG: group II intron reverse transcriptase/maturase [Methanosarcinales archaeon]|nr:group II intron reverse transcriptase/maturase [Methanosarcinales archaeon]
MSKKKKFHSLIDKVWNWRNLNEAWAKVKSNKGAGGIDEVSIAEFERNREQNLNEIQRLLRQDRYKPNPVKRVYIPKPDGKQRPLGIPTIRDRVVQQALKNVIEPIFEAEFSDSSFGYRPGKNAKQAIERIEEVRDEGHEWVVDADIKAFFDTVNHEKLIDEVAERISDGRVLRLIRSFLEADIMEQGQGLARNVIGTPQGGVISPLLANICLHYFDERMAELGYEVVRYADDFIVLCGSEEEARGALSQVKRVLRELELTLHSEKTSLKNIREGVDFLGFTVYIGHKVPRKEAVRKYKDAVRRVTRRNLPINLEMVIQRLNPIVIGWGNYYRIASVKSLYKSLDGWTRMRLRAFKEKKKSYNSNRRITNVFLSNLGLKSLSSLLNP